MGTVSSIHDVTRRIAVEFPHCAQWTRCRRTAANRWIALGWWRCAQKGHAAAAPLRPEDSRWVGGDAPAGHAAIAPLQPEDCAGLVALCPMDTVLPLRCDPMAHGELLALRPVNALLPRRCDPGDALLEATRGLRWSGSAAFGGRGARHPL